MRPRERNYLSDMLKAAKLAQAFVEDVDWDAFQLDLMRQSAVTRQLEIIGEAARRISEASQAERPEIPWRQIIGMRNRLVHEYDRVNVITLWNTIQLALPDLIATLETIIATEEP